MRAASRSSKEGRVESYVSRLRRVQRTGVVGVESIVGKALAVLVLPTPAALDA